MHLVSRIGYTVGASVASAEIQIRDISSLCVGIMYGSHCHSLFLPQEFLKSQVLPMVAELNLSSSVSTGTLSLRGLSAAGPCKPYLLPSTAKVDRLPSRSRSALRSPTLCSLSPLSPSSPQIDCLSLESCHLGSIELENPNRQTCTRKNSLLSG